MDLFYICIYFDRVLTRSNDSLGQQFPKQSTVWTKDLLHESPNGLSEPPGDQSEVLLCGLHVKVSVSAIAEATVQWCTVNKELASLTLNPLT